jgi:hypothetical protein
MIVLLIFTGLLSHVCTQSRAKKCIDSRKHLTFREVADIELMDEIIDEDIQLIQGFFEDQAWDHVQYISKYTCPNYNTLYSVLSIQLE